MNAEKVQAMPSRTTRIRMRRRGASLMEFVLLLPLMLFMLLFVVDMGRMVFTYGVLSDTTYSTARHMAARGQWTDAEVRSDFLESLGPSIPGRYSRTHANVSSAGRSCNATNKWVKVTGTYRQNFATPGLGALLGLFGGETIDTRGRWKLEARAVVLCEATRD